MKGKIYHVSRLNYILTYVLVIVIIAVPFFFYQNQYIIISSIALILILLLILEIIVRSNDLIIGEHEILNDIGILSKKKIAIHYGNITDLRVNQSFIQMIFGFGDLHINTSGTTKVEIIVHGFSNVNEIHELISKRIRVFKISRAHPKAWFPLDTFWPTRTMSRKLPRLTKNKTKKIIL